MLRLNDRVRILAAPEVVWPHVADPLRAAEWNPKIVAVDREPGRLLVPGERFQIIYRMSGRNRESAASVLECQAPSRLVVRHDFPEATGDRFALECYELESRDGGTRLTQSIDLSHAIPIGWLVVIWLIHLVGNPVGTPYLHTLKTIVERDV